MYKFLLFGPRYHKSSQPGGIVVSFELLLKDLEVRGVDCIVIDTNKNNYRSSVIAMIKILWNAAKLIPKSSHVSLHGTAKDYVFIAPFVVWWARVFGKSVSLRKFAGSFREVYRSSGAVSRLLIRYALKNASVNFFQTHYLVGFFSRFNPNTFWMPTSRPRPVMQRVERPFGKRFIFLGHVRWEKGILELIEAANQLPDEYQVDIYGQMVNPELEERIAHSKACYKGVLKQENVVETLAHYDVLVLPSFWSGEGYPGVIIEAFSVGLPIVATPLDGIKEIVTHGENGLLVDPKKKGQLEDAMRSFTVKGYAVFSEKAKASFEQFDSSVVTKMFLEATVVKSVEKNL
ncbi:glycosyltransferase family 4 protein [Marinobacter sp.]|uniref:glycosyltransferase family 4 protein n=1 Tax=Marinobacter sp. TaxID=50741 RepID=UPI00384DA99A